VVGGCAQWKDGTGSTSLVASHTADSVLDSPQRVVIEVDFVNTTIDSRDPEQSADLWQWVDEASVDAALRKRLIDNGLRVGFVSNQERFDSKLKEITVQQNAVEEFMSQASVASEVSHGSQRLPMRFGRRYELALRQPFEGSHVALVRDGDEVIGQTLANAQYFLAMTASPADTLQRVNLTVLPEVQYGAARQKWVSSDSAIRIDTLRETWSLEMIKLGLVAAAGDLIVIAPDTPLRGLASKMLTGNGADQNEQQLIVLIRVVQVPGPGKET
jgi:hypothetical protein